MEKKLKRIQWLEPLYISNNISDPKKVQQKINRNAGLIEYYVLVLSDKNDEELEIYRTFELMKPHMRERQFQGVGIAKGYNAALVLVAKIAKEAYKATGHCNLKEYLLSRDVKEVVE